MFNVHQVLAAHALLNSGRPQHGPPVALSPSIPRVPWHPNQSQVPAPSPSGSMLTQAIARSSPRRPRGEKKPIPDEQKDEKYFERRKRNNLAAKKSRDQRKQREDTIAVRASLLEKENASLRSQVSALRDERNSLQTLLLFRRHLFQQQQIQKHPESMNQHLFGLFMLEHQQRLRELQRSSPSHNSDTSLDEKVVDLSRPRSGLTTPGTPSPSPKEMFRRNSTVITAT